MSDFAKDEIVTCWCGAAVIRYELPEHRKKFHGDHAATCRKRLRQMAACTCGVINYAKSEPHVPKEKE